MLRAEEGIPAKDERPAVKVRALKSKLRRRSVATSLAHLLTKS
jgi:hypothetical protein